MLIKKTKSQSILTDTVYVSNGSDYTLVHAGSRIHSKLNICYGSVLQ